MVKRLAALVTVVFAGFVGVMVLATEPCACLTPTAITNMAGQEIVRAVETFRTDHQRCPTYGELFTAVKERARAATTRLSPQVDRETLEPFEAPAIDPVTGAASGEISRHQVYYAVTADGSACSVRAAVPGLLFGVFRHGTQLVTPVPQ